MRGNYAVAGRNDDYWAFLECPVCHGAVVAHCSGGRNPPANVHGSLSAAFRETRHYPLRPAVDAPDFLPADVLRIYLRAAEALRRDDTDSAAILVRKALEAALHSAFAATGGRLVDRIDTLAKEHRLTEALAHWAHAIRLDGNAAAHDLSEPDRENTAELLRFLHVFLLYVFTLPAMVEQRQGKD